MSDKLYAIGLTAILWLIIELSLINFLPINIFTIIFIFSVSVASYILLKFLYDGVKKSLEDEIS